MSAPPPIAAIILAAGRSTRFGAPKQIAELDGKPLVRHVAEAALGSRAHPVIVILGAAAEQTRGALHGLDVGFVHAADFEAGLSRSLRAGLAALPPGIAGTLVLLADMPHVSAQVIDRLIDCFAASGQPGAVVPVHAGQRGNPVLLGRKLFAAAAALEGDRGARQILGADAIECAMSDGSVNIDIDTPEDLARLTALRR